MDCLSERERPKRIEEPAKRQVFRVAAALAVVLSPANGLPGFLPQASSHTPHVHAQGPPPGPGGSGGGSAGGFDHLGVWHRQAERESLRRLNVERQKQLNEDSAKLFKLAADLKASVDNHSRENPSADSVRMAEEIAKLAHGVGAKMKMTFN